jgi:hypothetical protein
MTLSCLVGSLGATMARADSVTLRLANNNLDFGYLGLNAASKTMLLSDKFARKHEICQSRR